MEFASVSEAKRFFISTAPRGSSPRYVGELGYSYFVAGSTYAGRYKREFGSEEEALEFVRDLKGKPVAVQCHPSKPSTSTLQESSVETLLSTRPPKPPAEVELFKSALAEDSLSWPKPVLWACVGLSAVGLVLSLWVHLGAVMGRRVAPEAFFWILHIGIFVVWLPTVLVARKRVGNRRSKDYWKLALQGSPEWMRYMVYGFFGYAFVNFALFVRLAFAILFISFMVGAPAWAQEALAVGLKGPVHTVLAEEFKSDDGVHREAMGSTLDIYDSKGYQLEFFRYKPDGSLWAHMVYSRDGSRIFKIQATGIPPFRSSSTQNVFDAEGHVIETDTYDQNGTLISKSTNDLVQQHGDSATYLRRETSADGADSTAEINETTDPQRGITRQVQTKDGKPDTDWVIQRNADGKPVKDKIVYADGSYNERERRADGTTVEDRYSAATKSHTYQTSDAHGNLIEVIQGSDSQYIRCTYSFGTDGRPTGQINYDAAGKILDKSTVEYEDDSHDNWVEKKSMVWDTKLDPLEPKIVLTTLRTINYY